MTIKFGTDGWRGIIDDDFTDDNVRIVARALAVYLQKDKPAGSGVMVGYDNRRKAEDFARISAEELSQAGFAVTLSDVAISSPALAFAVKHNGAMGGVMITASHNPPTFNGFKFKANYGGSGMPEIMSKIESYLGENPVPINGSIVTADITSDYLNHLATLVDINLIKSAGWRVVVDCMYGSGIGYLEKLLAGGKTEVISIRSTRDLNFGGINPEPIAKNLQALFNAVKFNGAFAGIALDGDADRIGAADENGNIVDSHRIFAVSLLHLVEKRGWRGPVVKTVSTTSMIDILCKQLSLPYSVTPIGFKYICEKMLQEDVLIGGEESGGIGIRGHLPERDGVLMGLLLMEAMAQSGKKLGELVNDVYARCGFHAYNRIDMHPNVADMPAIRDRITNANNSELADRKIESIDKKDGTKFYFTDGAWLLLRPSGTEPVVRVYAEAESDKAVEILLSAGENLVNGSK
jgi:phosphomannomutase